MGILKNLNWVDILIVILLIKSAYTGARTGFTAEIFKLIGTIIGIILGLHYFNRLSYVITGYINIPTWIAQIFILLTIIIIVRVIFKYGIVLLLKVLNIQFVLGLERIGGIVIGFGRAILLSGLILIAVTFLPIKYINISIYEESTLAPYFIKTVQVVYSSAIKLIPSQEAQTIPTELPAKQSKK